MMNSDVKTVHMTSLGVICYTISVRAREINERARSSFDCGMSFEMHFAASRLRRCVVPGNRNEKISKISTRWAGKSRVHFSNN